MYLFKSCALSRTLSGKAWLGCSDAYQPVTQSRAIGLPCAAALVDRNRFQHRVVQAATTIVVPRLRGNRISRLETFRPRNARRALSQGCLQKPTDYWPQQG